MKRLHMQSPHLRNEAGKDRWPTGYDATLNLRLLPRSGLVQSPLRAMAGSADVWFEMPIRDRDETAAVET